MKNFCAAAAATTVKTFRFHKGAHLALWWEWRAGFGINLSTSSSQTAKIVIWGGDWGGFDVAGKFAVQQLNTPTTLTPWFVVAVRCK